MIFVDSNVPMYLIGADHPHKSDAIRILDSLVAKGEPLVTDAEVFQEILHRCGAIGRPDAIQPAFQAVLDICDEVFPIRLEDVQEAKVVMTGRKDFSARDALHAAVMNSHNVTRIISFDSTFDAIPGIERFS